MGKIKKKVDNEKWKGKRKDKKKGKREVKKTQGDGRKSKNKKN